MHHSKIRCRLAATGQKPALPRRSIAVRFRPNKQTPAGRVECDGVCHKETYAVQQTASYSITSSALTSSVFGTLKPSAFAVLRLMTNSNLVGCITGRSAGFSPLRIRPL